MCKNAAAIVGSYVCLFARKRIYSRDVYTSNILTYLFDIRERKRGKSASVFLWACGKSHKLERKRIMWYKVHTFVRQCNEYCLLELFVNKESIEIVNDCL